MKPAAPTDDTKPGPLAAVLGTSAKSAFSKVKQSRALELLVELNVALSEQAAEESALEQDLADVLTPAEATAVSANIAATGGIAQRLENVIGRVRANTAALRDMRNRAEDLRS